MKRWSRKDITSGFADIKKDISTLSDNSKRDYEDLKKDLKYHTDDIKRDVDHKTQDIRRDIEYKSGDIRRDIASNSTKLDGLDRKLGSELSLELKLEINKISTNLKESIERNALSKEAIEKEVTALLKKTEQRILKELDEQLAEASESFKESLASEIRVLVTLPMLQKVTEQLAHGMTLSASAQEEFRAQLRKTFVDYEAIQKRFGLKQVRQRQTAEE